MTRCRDFRWWLVRYGRKRQQVRLARCRPTGPQTVDEHVACRIRPEFENNVFDFLAYRKIAAFHSGAGHILVTRIDDNKAMRVTEKVSPEAPQIIAPCVEQLGTNRPTQHTSLRLYRPCRVARRCRRRRVT